LRFITGPAFLILGCLRLAAAASALDAALDSLSELHEFREVALLPDHSKVAWIETSPAKEGGPAPSLSVYIKELGDSSAGIKRVGDPAVRAQGLTWSQDGKLAYLSDSESHGQLQLYVVDKPGHGKPHKIGISKATWAMRIGRPMAKASRCCGSKESRAFRAQRRPRPHRRE